MPRVVGKGSTALVTGCSSGLGLALVRHLLDQGLKVWGISRRPPSSLNGSNRFVWHKCDLTNPAALKPTLKQVSQEAAGLDLLINNAGFGHVGVLPENSPADIEYAVRVMLIAPVLATRFFLGDETRSSQAPPSVIVNTSSLAARLPIPLMPTYNAVKGGLSAFTLSMCLDRRSYPETRFIDFCPGDFRTPFADSFNDNTSEPERVKYLRRLVDHHTRGPEPERAARDLWRAIKRRKEGTVYSGSFFQTYLAPLGPRVLPPRWLRSSIRRYYGMA